jgi:hypothetical protein
LVFQFVQAFAVSALGPDAQLSSNDASSIIEPKFTTETLVSVGKCSIALLNSLPEHSHFRAVLIANLLPRDLPVKDAAQLSGVKESTVYAARSEYPNGEIGELAAKYPSNVHRQRISDLEQEIIRQFIMDQCPGKSGQPREHYYQRITDQKLYEEYEKQPPDLLAQLLNALNDPNITTSTEHDTASQTLLSKLRKHEQVLGFLRFVQSDPSAADAFAGGHTPGPAQLVIDYLLEPSAGASAKPRSRQTFDKLKHELPLSHLHRYYGEFSCAICANGRTALSTLQSLGAKSESELRETDQARLRKAKKDKQKFDWHMQVLDSQPKAIETVLARLDSSSAAVLVDFGSYDTHPNVGEKEKIPLSSFVLVIQRQGGQRAYVDVLCANKSKQKGDFFFIREAMIHLFRQTSLFAGLDTLYFISDTGSKQFRSRFAFALFAGLGIEMNVKIWWLFRVERHGHSLCDSHLGLSAQAITRSLSDTEHRALHDPARSSIVLAPLSDAHALQELFLQTFKKGTHKHQYECIVLADIDRSESLKPNVRPVPGTARIHQVEFISATEIAVKDLSSDQEDEKRKLKFSAPWNLLLGNSEFFFFVCSLLSSGFFGSV